jgi:MFS transporter, SHS family, lactate transporter
LCLPETDTYIQQKQMEKENEGTVDMRSFIKESSKNIKTHWLMFVYMTLLLAGLNFQTHGVSRKRAWNGPC